MEMLALANFAGVGSLQMTVELATEQAVGPDGNVTNTIKIPEQEICYTRSKSIHSSKAVIDFNFHDPCDLLLHVCLGRMHSVSPHAIQQ